ncbi:MATH domain and coiled-coil domain-containing protein [Senna tora]|uniref:MATH domain and coiled-coil domain-containing protein n=1 Tax=Senna tora TaxID=362788 RepID=A0A834WGW0_9FABA|nr:MATH domain and coiled-coil domain-containing protein [Senna tora]
MQMDKQQTNNFTKGKFTWTIQNFSKLNSQNLHSEAFVVGGYPWRILLYPKGNDTDHLSLYLAAADTTSLAYDWSRNATFSLAVINHQDAKWTVKSETQHRFNSNVSDWGFTKFMPISAIEKGYLVNDMFIIVAEVSVLKSGNENQAAVDTSQKSGGQSRQTEVEPTQKEDQGQNENIAPPLSAQSSREPIEHIGDPSLPTELSSTPVAELMDFKNVGKIEKAFVPLLEEICSKHPSLIESQQKRTPQYSEWAFTALGRVLHFLNSKRVKDMNDEASDHLQILWDELETFKFDLIWLEPHVHSALGMKTYLEKAKQLKKLKEKEVALDMEIKRLTAKLAAAKTDFEITTRDLVQAQEGFEERDIDVILGYGRP